MREKLLRKRWHNRVRLQDKSRIACGVRRGGVPIDTHLNDNGAGSLRNGNGTMNVSRSIMFAVGCSLRAGPRSLSKFVVVRKSAFKMIHSKEKCKRRMMLNCCLLGCWIDRYLYFIAVTVTFTFSPRAQRVVFSAAGKNFGVWRLTHDPHVRDWANRYHTQCFSADGRFVCYPHFSDGKNDTAAFASST